MSLTGTKDFANTNQGIVDGRPEGTQPDPAPVTLDTVIDRDAADEKSSRYQKADATFPGATSADVHRGIGHPGSGMTSKELHHDGKGGKSGKKSEGEGVSQWGPPAERNKVLGREERDRERFGSA